MRSALAIAIARLANALMKRPAVIAVHDLIYACSEKDVLQESSI
jgi:hypothetical protein